MHCVMSNKKAYSINEHQVQGSVKLVCKEGTFYDLICGSLLHIYSYQLLHAYTDNEVGSHLADSILLLSFLVISLNCIFSKSIDIKQNIIMQCLSKHAVCSGASIKQTPLGNSLLAVIERQFM